MLQWSLAYIGAALAIAHPERRYHRAATMRDGHAILDFIASEKPTRRNEWLLKVLASEAAMFVGDKAGALSAAHEALALTPDSLNAPNG